MWNYCVATRQLVFCPQRHDDVNAQQVRSSHVNNTCQKRLNEGWVRKERGNLTTARRVVIIWVCLGQNKLCVAIRQQQKVQLGNLLNVLMPGNEWKVTYYTSWVICPTLLKTSDGFWSTLHHFESDPNDIVHSCGWYSCDADSMRLN